jgi:hypothetical protein
MAYAIYKTQAVKHSSEDDLPGAHYYANLWDDDHPEYGVIKIRAHSDDDVVLMARVTETGVKLPMSELIEAYMTLRDMRGVQ